MRSVLVTAFEPFGGETVNASWEAARRLDGLTESDVRIAALRLSCAYGLCVDELFATAGRLRPCAVLMTGQAAGRGEVCVERFARNQVSVLLRDNRGVVRPAAPEAPDAIETAAPAEAVAREIRAAGIEARVSTDAGDYVCNHLYYHALRRLAEASQGTPAIFIHLPAAPEQVPWGAPALATAEAARALGAAAKVLAAADRQTAILNDFAS